MQPITIPKELAKNSAMNYDFLRAEGIKLIQEIGGTVWTDHNTHDPGINMLEQICYAITDLAYRLDYDITDLLGDKATAYNELYSPATILTTSPVTMLDYRKLIIDTKGARNAWLEKVNTTTTKGLYKVAIEFDDAETATGNLEEVVKQKLRASRALCEDFLEVKVLDKQKIRFGGTVEISDNADDINQLAADLLYSLHWSLSPAITFYTLQELQEKGKGTDGIFDGPRLNYGFIDDDELLKHDRRHEIHASDFIKDIMDVEHVITVQKFAIASGSTQVKNWVFPLDTSRTPSLDDKPTLDNLIFKVRGIEISINKDRVIELYNAKKRAFVSKRTLRLEEKDIVIAVGQDRAIENYYSIQEQFSTNFGIGTTGLPDSVSEKRKAQAKQLSAYLTFFDQLLANYFSQVANFYQLVGFSSANFTTNFYQSLIGKVAGLEDILKDSASYTSYINENTDHEPKNLLRKNKFLNHLLARFGEKFAAYGMLAQDVEEDTIANQQKLIKDKIEFLNAYAQISAARGKAFDYGTDDHKTGLELRIAKKLGVEDTEEFHMIEHLFLRPNDKNQTTLETYYQSNAIENLAVIEATQSTKITAQDHGLNAGDRLLIVENGIPLDVFEILNNSEVDFEIDTVLKLTTEDAVITWHRVDPDIRFHVFTDAISSFEGGPNNSTTRFKAAHQLHAGDEVKIFGSHSFDGVHTVLSTTTSDFELEIPFQASSSAVRFTKVTSQADSYSLQVTFILPEESGRYQNHMFKKFVENTIREESPAHITTHVKWLSATEIIGFEKAYQRFLAEMKEQ